MYLVIINNANISYRAECVLKHRVGSLMEKTKKKFGSYVVQKVSILT